MLFFSRSWFFSDFQFLFSSTLSTTLNHCSHESLWIECILDFVVSPGRNFTLTDLPCNSHDLLFIHFLCNCVCRSMCAHSIFHTDCYQFNFSSRCVDVVHLQFFLFLLCFEINFLCYCICMYAITSKSAFNIV